jgi:peptide/nickel transport system permease protein
MTSYLIRRFLFGAILIALATIVSFSILKLSPGSSIAFDDPRVSQEYIDAQKRIFGLDQPAWRQYINWIGGLATGNLGVSIQYKQPVWDVIKPRLLATLSMNLVALAVTWLVAIPLGIYAAVNQYKLGDRVLSLVSFVGMSLPGFFIAMLLMWWLAGEWNLLPAGGLTDIDHAKYSPLGQFLDYLRHMIIPVIVLVIGALAGLQRLMRGNMLETLRMQYVQTARAKGLPENRVIYKHALRNAINPLVTILGFQFAGLFGGAAILENVINFPGMGQLMLEALKSKDQFVVLTVFLLGSVMLVVGSLLADILLVLVDPRVSYE